MMEKMEVMMDTVKDKSKMKTYLIACEFHDNDNVSGNCDSLSKFEAQLFKIGTFKHLFKHVYLYRTESEIETSKYLFDEFYNNFNMYDRLFITEINLENTFGMTFESVWKWLGIRNNSIIK
jgi:hypothetical protein